MRTVTTKRLYALANYNNVTLEDSIQIGDNTPEEVINKIVFLQMLNVELNYMKYVQLHDKVNHAGTIDDAIVLLEDTKLTTLKDISDLLKETK